MYKSLNIRGIIVLAEVISYKVEFDVLKYVIEPRSNTITVMIIDWDFNISAD